MDFVIKVYPQGQMSQALDALQLGANDPAQQILSPTTYLAEMAAMQFKSLNQLHVNEW